MVWWKGSKGAERMEHDTMRGVGLYVCVRVCVCTCTRVYVCESLIKLRYWKFRF